ncbi:MAG TPA: putative 2OG-Fe(II) oxygenase [Novosphingobium sp.]|nr:putative 2OG-Fe(II) oxygenase [Novosphingobium sp.]
MSGIGPPGSPQAADALAGRIAADPGDLVARHNLANELRRLDRLPEALASIDAAWSGGLRTPETATLRGQILTDLGRFDEALEAYRDAIGLRPDYVAAHSALAQLLPQMGWAEQALDSFGPALARSPGTGVLWVAAMEAAKSHRAHEQLLAWADAAEQRFGSDTMVTTFAANALSALGRDDEAFTRLARALALEPDFAPAHATMAHLLIRLGEPAQAAAAAGEATRLAPDDQSGWALLGVALRLLEDEREHWLCDYERLVMPIDLALEPGLGAVLEKGHLARAQPAEQSLRGGTQTGGNLFESAEPMLLRLARQIADRVGETLARLPADPTHPFLARNTGGIDFAGAWSVRLAGAGFHIGHIHPAGWLSSALYVSLPESVRAGTGEGALTFGVPDAALGLDLPPRRLVQPREGQLVVFPSYFWHGTTPFESSSHRLTLAFDALPAQHRLDNAAVQR